MSKIFNTISVLGGLVGGTLTFIFGGFDVLLKVLIVLVILDYITGFIKGVYTKTLSSETGFKGLLKKFIVFIVVIVAVLLQRVINDAVPLWKLWNLQGLLPNSVKTASRMWMWKSNTIPWTKAGPRIP